jgi:hypothetical protein
MPPAKEVHFFDRSTEYPTPNRLATSSALRRVVGLNRWDREHTWSGVTHTCRSLLWRNFGKARWWSRWTFGHVDDDWYRGLFSEAEPHQECGEVSPGYAILRDEDVQGFKAMNSDIKLIRLIRNPINRAWSAIRYNVNKGRSGLRLDCVDGIINALESPRMVLRGDYERTVDTYLRHFKSSQLLLGFYDAIRDDPEGLLNGIADFLGVAPFASGVIDNQVVINASPVQEMPDAVREYLVACYGPVVESLADRFGGYARWWADGHSTTSHAELASVLHPSDVRDHD